MTTTSKSSIESIAFTENAIQFAQKQEELFPNIPLSIVRMTNFNKGTVQVSRVALASDGGEYIVKGVSDGSDHDIVYIEKSIGHKILKHMSPVSEFFCHEIANLCGIPVPQYRLLIDGNDIYFGSLLDQGHKEKDEAEIINSFIDPETINDLFFKQLWTIYAFDCFFFNTDRHLKNFLYLKSVHFADNIQLKPFDYGFATFAFLDYPYQEPFIHKTECNTRKLMKIIDDALSKNQEYLHKRKLYLETAKDQLDRLLTISKEKITEIMYSIPKEWMSETERKRFIEWWDSRNLTTRVNTIKEKELI